jgi:hypothetical protein
MATPVDSATLILKLFELRREPVLGEARAWFLREFNPNTFDDALELVRGPEERLVSNGHRILGYGSLARRPRSN